MFICQKIDGEITLDFVQATYHAVNFANWFNSEKAHEIQFVESIDDIQYATKSDIPVGSVEFVEGFYNKFHNLDLKPYNIPKILRKYSKRHIYDGDENTVINKQTFCKSADKLKGFTDIIDSSTELEHGNYIFSELIDIESEWRCFVYKGQLLGVHNYVNSLSHYPDINEIKNMIKDFNELDAYTLDAGVNNEGTFIIEVHDFYSCGLYGFRDFSKIINMTIASHYQKIRR